LVFKDFIYIVAINEIKDLTNPNAFIKVDEPSFCSKEESSDIADENEKDVNFMDDSNLDNFEIISDK
jgi:hypothetical protein